mgnify:CR=1 FL=1
MNTVGRLFEEGEYFVGDLIFAGELMTDAVEVLKPLLASSESTGTKTKMILCTVKDDLHDIGKNIVRSMLEAGGFEVLDLGIDVAPEKIIETAKAENIHIVALSGVLTLALDSMRKTIAAFKEAGMDDVKIIIGGCPVTEDGRRRVGIQSAKNCESLLRVGSRTQRINPACFPGLPQKECIHLRRSRLFILHRR